MSLDNLDILRYFRHLYPASGHGPRGSVSMFQDSPAYRSGIEEIGSWIETMQKDLSILSLSPAISGSNRNRSWSFHIRRKVTVLIDHVTLRVRYSTRH